MDPTGAQDPTDSLATQQQQVPPPDAVVTTPPEATLPPDNSLIDDDDGPTPEQLAEMRAKFWSQDNTAEPPAPSVPETRTEPAAAAPPSEPAAPPVEPGAQSFPQYRLDAGNDPKKDQFLKLLRNGVEPTIATAAVYGASPPVPETRTEPTPVAPAAPAEPAPDAEVARIEQELLALAEEPWADGYERKRTELLTQHNRAVARAERAAMEAQLRAEEQAEAAREAEYTALVQRFPGFDAPNHRLRQECDVVLAQWRAVNDPRLQHPNLMTVVAESAAAQLYAAGISLTQQTPAQAPVPAPQPVPAARFTPGSPGGAPPAPMPQYSADELEELWERDPAQARAVLDRSRAMIARR